MDMVLWTALGVGGATVVGAAIGFIFKKISHKFSDIVLAFAAGIMLAAAILGLIIPSFDYGYELFEFTGFGETWNKLLSLALVFLGIFAGALCINLLDKLVPHLHGMVGVDIDGHCCDDKSQINKVLLFVMAIAIHNLPEGIAAGVGFGSDNTAEALMIAGGIALQNIPEGMVLIPPMLGAGVTPRRAFLIALGTGLVEVAGTFLGYIFVTVSISILPFALAFAGGTMLYVIAGDMIPKTHGGAYRGRSTYALLLGFAFMVVFDAVL